MRGTTPSRARVVDGGTQVHALGEGDELLIVQESQMDVGARQGAGSSRDDEGLGAEVGDPYTAGALVGVQEREEGDVEVAGADRSEHLRCGALDQGDPDAGDAR